MPYTDQELLEIYRHLTLGIDPSVSDHAVICALARHTRMACLDDQDALNAVFDLIDDSADVAALTYQFFTGAIPTALYVEPLEIASHLYPAYLPEVSTEDLLLERIGADGITLSGLGNDCIDFDRSRGAYAAGFFSGQPYEPVAAFIPESGYDQPYRPTRKYRRYGRWSNKTKQGKRRRR